VFALSGLQSFAMTAKQVEDLRKFGSLFLFLQAIAIVTWLFGREGSLLVKASMATVVTASACLVDRA
jgi:hypothetical protein